MQTDFVIVNVCLDLRALLFHEKAEHVDPDRFGIVKFGLDVRALLFHEEAKRVDPDRFCHCEILSGSTRPSVP